MDVIKSDLTQFEEFLLKEYENIAKAHFEAQKQLAVFFRYYILFASVPLLYFSSISEDTKRVITLKDLSLLLISLAVVGFFFYIFVTKIKHEIVLYAKTVNGIRFHFYNIPSAKQEGIDLKSIRVLPTDITTPNNESWDNPVLLIIVIINSLFLYLGLNWFLTNRPTLVIVICVAAAIIHVIANLWLSNKQGRKFP